MARKLIIGLVPNQIQKLQCTVQPVNLADLNFGGSVGYKLFWHPY